MAVYKHVYKLSCVIMTREVVNRVTKARLSLSNYLSAQLLEHL